jgi:hypothetical protein
VPRCARVLIEPRLRRVCWASWPLSSPRVLPVASAPDRPGRLDASRICPAAGDLRECRAGPPATAARSALWVVSRTSWRRASTRATARRAVARRASCGGPSCRARRDGCAFAPGVRRSAVSRQEQPVPRPPGYAGEVDHGDCCRVCRGYDGWAPSTSADALPAVLATAVALAVEIRVAAWILARGLTRWLACSTAGTRPLRRRTTAPRLRPTSRGRAGRRRASRRSTRPDAVIGAKPPSCPGIPMEPVVPRRVVDGWVGW